MSSCPNSLPTLLASLVIGLRHNVVDDSGNPYRLPCRYYRQTPCFCALFLTRPWLPLPLSGSQRTIAGSNMSGSRVTGHHPHPGSNPKHFNIIGIGGRRSEAYHFAVVVGVNFTKRPQGQIIGTPVHIGTAAVGPLCFPTRACVCSFAALIWFQDVSGVLMPWSLLLPESVQLKEKCANKICARCFGGCCVPLCGHLLTWIMA